MVIVQYSYCINTFKTPYTWRLSSSVDHITTYLGHVWWKTSLLFAGISLFRQSHREKRSIFYVQGFADENGHSQGGGYHDNGGGYGGDGGGNSGHGWGHSGHGGGYGGHGGGYGGHGGGYGGHGGGYGGYGEGYGHSNGGFRKNGQHNIGQYLFDHNTDHKFEGVGGRSYNFGHGHKHRKYGKGAMGYDNLGKLPIYLIDIGDGDVVTPVPVAIITPNPGASWMYL